MKITNLTRPRGWRVTATALAAVALVGGAVALAPHLAAMHGTTPVSNVDAAVNGTGNGTTRASNVDVAVNGTANGHVNIGGGIHTAETVYDYPGSGYPGLGLAPLMSFFLFNGDWVHIQCYMVGDPVRGPNGWGSGNTDEYWDQIDNSAEGSPIGLAPGHTAVVPDAEISTSWSELGISVNNIVPNCDSGDASPTDSTPGIVNASGVKEYDFADNGTGYPNEGLPTVGLPLPYNDHVTVFCYLVGDPVSGPDGQGAGHIDEYWDEIGRWTSGPDGGIHLGVVPDADIQTPDGIVNELVPAC